jgi:hypothetical protein
MNEEHEMTQAETIREIQALRREGWSDTKILNHLLEILGDIPTPTSKPETK